MSETILITGATGFLGSHLLETLLAEGYKVVILKRSFSNTWRINHLLDRIKSYDVDKEPLEKVFSVHRIDIVVHLATLYRKFHKIDEIDDMIYSNITFPTKLLELAIANKVDGFINTGTFFEYAFDHLPVTENSERNNFNLYSVTKNSFEAILKHYANTQEIRCVTLKLFTPYGPRDETKKIIPYMILNMLQDKPLSLSEGFQKLDFVYAKDIASAYLSAIKNISRFRSEDFNIASGRSYSIREAVSIIEDILGRPGIKQWGVASKNDIDIVLADNSKAKELLAWEPKYSFVEGIRETIEYYRMELCR